MSVNLPICPFHIKASPTGWRFLVSKTTKKHIIFATNSPNSIVLYKNLIVIIIITILIGVLGSFIGYFTTKPVYTKRCEIMLRVELASGNTITNSTSAAKDYLPTVASAIKSPATMELAKRINGEENIDNGIKRNAVSVSYSEDSLVFSISYTDSSPELAESRLKDVVAASNRILNEKKLIAVSSVRLIELQNTYSLSSSSSLVYYIIASWMLGFAFAVVFITIKFLMDARIKTAEELELITGTEIFAVIEE